MIRFRLCILSQTDAVTSGSHIWGHVMAIYPSEVNFDRSRCCPISSLYS